MNLVRAPWVRRGIPSPWEGGGMGWEGKATEGKGGMGKDGVGYINTGRTPPMRVFLPLLLPHLTFVQNLLL